MLRYIVTLVMGMVVYVALIIGPAWAVTGRLDWPRGWVALGVLCAVSVLGGIWLLVTDPALARERSSIPRPQSRADRRATLLILLLVVGWFVAASIDGAQLHLLPPPPPAVSLWAGLGVFLLGNGLIGWVLRVNSFAATVVKVQRERQQRVIDTGPYAFVRHPMYLGAILFFAGLGLILESSAMALLALPVFALGFLPRIVIEEATLRRDLEGYADYQERVRARILPGLF